MTNVQRSWPRGCRGAWARRGVVLVKVAIVLPVLVGMLGLVIDVGMLFAGHRQVQNAADAAALAAAMDLVRGKPAGDARATADTFVRDRNALGSAVPLVAGESFHFPPATGAYAGKANYVEVQVTFPMQTLFIQVLGVDPNRLVRGRAVAGFEPVAAGEGVMVLDRNARPGLRTSSNRASIRVNGRIVVNSEGGGVDENGAAVSGTGNGNVATAGSGGIYASDINIVGGVDSPTYFRPYVTDDPSPLHCRTLPEPDPLINLPTPIVGNGVDPTRRGTVSVTNNGASFSIPSGLNFKAVGGESVGNGLYTAQPNQVFLFPGIYEDITVQGGSVVFMPGIYILAPTKPNTGLKLTGGTTVGKGIMMYTTGGNYNAFTGTPDVNDREQQPPAGDGALFGNVEMTANATFSPIDTKLYPYATLYPGAPAMSDAFDGMLFYQRRRNTNGAKITGNSSAGGLTGTIYAKWARFDISGQGTYNAQFLVGSMDVTGQGVVTVNAGGKQRGRANRVYLVE